MKEQFELEPSNDPIREAINTVSTTDDFESLAKLAFNNELVGSKFNPLRYEFLKGLQSFKGQKFTDLYPEYNTKTGILTDKHGEKVHISQINDEPTDEKFFEQYRSTIVEFLSLRDEDFTQTA